MCADNRTNNLMHVRRQSHDPPNTCAQVSRELSAAPPRQPPSHPPLSPLHSSNILSPLLPPPHRQLPSSSRMLSRNISTPALMSYKHDNNRQQARSDLIPASFSPAVGPRLDLVAAPPCALRRYTAATGCDRLRRRRRGDGVAEEEEEEARRLYVVDDLVVVVYAEIVISRHSPEPGYPHAS
eukprot:GHVS01061027.1.p1 GENE.GHVS01061027.1~~GHVS01061027.1.p1  ORF type:complete len:182 (-),score=44.19 GHVS01061027.1:892-1437(-)